MIVFVGLRNLSNDLLTCSERVTEGEAGERGVAAGRAAIDAQLLGVHQALVSEVTRAGTAVVDVVHTPAATASKHVQQRHVGQQEILRRDAGRLETAFKLVVTYIKSRSIVNKLKKIKIWLNFFYVLRTIIKSPLSVSENAKLHICLIKSIVISDTNVMPRLVT